MAAPVATNLVTGFLGAGKTTFIRSLLARHAPGERWAVLLNEFGAVKLDAEHDGAIAIREVEGGCICCTGRVTLRVALTRLLREVRPDRLLLEPSALGHASRALELFRDPWLGPALDLRSVVCVVDPAQFADPRVRRVENYDEMIALADVVALSKVVSAEQAAAVRGYAGSMSPAKRAVVEADDFPLALLDRPAPT